MGILSIICHNIIYNKGWDIKKTGIKYNLKWFGTERAKHSKYIL